MASIPELLMQMGPTWHAALAIVGACLWLLAVRRVVRDMGRSTTIPLKFTRSVDGIVDADRVVHLSGTRRREAI